MMDKQTILITGARGFIAGALTGFLRRNFSARYLLTGTSTRPPAPGEGWIVPCSLNNLRELEKILQRRRPDYIFHLAGGRRPDEEEIFTANFSTTKLLCEAVGKIKKYRPRIIIPGTAAEYGAPEAKGTLISESVRPRPGAWYGLVKHMQVTLSLMYARRGLDVVVARMFNILGRGVPASLAIGRFAADIARIEVGGQAPVIRTKNLSGKRDFLDVEDVCSALVAVAREGTSGEIYNVCSGRSYPIRELLKRLLRYSTVKNIRIEEDRSTSSDSYDVIGSNAKLRRAVDWKPRVSIEESLENTLKYYRQLQ